MAVTARDEGEYDFISRFFSPGVAVPEDPVTGSAHIMLIPYWSERLGKTQMFARRFPPVEETYAANSRATACGWAGRRRCI